MELHQENSSASLLPHGDCQRTEASFLQCLGKSQTIYNSSTPKRDNKDNPIEPASLFSSAEVSPVLRDSNLNARRNVVQNANSTKTSNLHNNNIFHKSKPTNSCIAQQRSSLVNVGFNVNRGSGSQQSDGVLINPILLHQQEVRRMKVNDINNSQSLLIPRKQTSLKHCSSTTNINTNTNRVMHENLSYNKFLISRKAAAAKVNYQRTDVGEVTIPMKMVDIPKQSGSFVSKTHSINELSAVQPHTRIKRMCSQEQILWAGFDTASNSTSFQRRLSSPVHIGAISMRNRCETDNSISLQQGLVHSFFNTVVSETKMNHPQNSV